jgi:hypothetical protein
MVPEINWGFSPDRPPPTSRPEPLPARACWPKGAKTRPTRASSLAPLKAWCVDHGYGAAQLQSLLIVPGLGERRIGSIPLVAL